MVRSAEIREKARYPGLGREERERLAGQQKWEICHLFIDKARYPGKEEAHRQVGGIICSFLCKKNNTHMYS